MEIVVIKIKFLIRIHRVLGRTYQCQLGTMLVSSVLCGMAGRYK